MRAGCGQLCNAAFRSAGGPDDNHIVCQLDHARKYGAHSQRIVDDHDPHRVGARPGRWIRHYVIGVEKHAHVTLPQAMPTS